MPQSSPKTLSRSRPTTRERIYQVTLFNPGIDSPRIKNLQEIYKKLQLSRIATKISGYTRLAEPSANRSLQKSSLCDFLESGPRSPALDATRPNLVNHHRTRHQKAEAGASRFLIPRLRGFPLSFSILDPGTFTKSHRFPYSMARRLPDHCPEWLGNCKTGDRPWGSRAGRSRAQASRVAQPLWAMVWESSRHGIREADAQEILGADEGCDFAFLRPR
jgi:hypothetical protein